MDEYNKFLEYQKFQEFQKLMSQSKPTPEQPPAKPVSFLEIVKQQTNEVDDNDDNDTSDDVADSDDSKNTGDVTLQNFNLSNVNPKSFHFSFNPNREFSVEEKKQSSRIITKALFSIPQFGFMIRAFDAICILTPLHITQGDTNPHICLYLQNSARKSRTGTMHLYYDLKTKKAYAVTMKITAGLEN